ncbi:MAG: DUF1549 and DUF1553 domain-containing protein, partial [Planctomycetota bacterium]
LVLLAIASSPARADDARDHWSYRVPVRPSVPRLAGDSWSRGAIDRFVLRRQREQGLTPAVAAPRDQLLRRVTLDLVGLPPSLSSMDSFEADGSPEAYERAVDRLFSSPAYGEHWARSWLDLARYADSNGFQRDGHREAWPYRDWVVRSLNADLPFDRFSIEQLAGDLLSGATLDQRIATGFHRGTTVNTEAGVDREEDRVLAVLDRVETTGTVWLGTTIACAQCHDHKYDPISQKDYYRFFAFFNQTETETKEQSEGASGRVFVGPYFELPLASDLARRRADVRAKLDALKAQRSRRVKEITPTLAAGIAEWSRSAPKDASKQVKKFLAIASSKRNKKQREQLRKFAISRDAKIRSLDAQIQQASKIVQSIRPAKTLVMKERPSSRKTRIFRRGDFLQKGEEVSAGVPALWNPFPKEAVRDRLSLARWLVSPDQPLVARVVVNRIWSAFFGRGLVSTPEDFGTRGERPSHPELLDWLAVEFVESGWSVKHIHRLIVTSSTYQQSAQASERARTLDPENRFLARANRLRLSAESIRDVALHASGRLSHRMGGPPVRPPQPAGTWAVIGNVDNTYRESRGEDRYRRGLYTVWRRSSPYPSFVAFDAPDRASSCVERSRSNTPLQALVLLNDPVYVELSVSLARRLFRFAKLRDNVEAALERGFRLAVSRRPDAMERRALRQLLDDAIARYASDPKRAEGLLRRFVGKEVPASFLRELAPWFSVASVILNLDETITRG